MIENGENYYHTRNSIRKDIAGSERDHNDIDIYQQDYKKQKKDWKYDVWKLTWLGARETKHDCLRWLIEKVGVYGLLKSRTKHIKEINKVLSNKVKKEERRNNKKPQNHH